MNRNCFLGTLSLCCILSVCGYISDIYDHNTPFHIDDTELLKPYKNHITALPEIFGFSKEQGHKLFPQYTYPRCSDNHYSYGEELEINTQNNTLTIKCRYDTSAYYLLGPTTDIKMAPPASTKKYLIPQKYTQPVSLSSHHEFALGVCGDYKGKDWDLRDFKIRQNETAYELALSKMNSLSLKSSSYKKPMMMVFLTCDSFSRRHFYRKLPKTIAFLNKLKKNDEYAVFDFKFHNIIGTDTAENQNRVFGEKHTQKFSGNQKVDFHDSEAIWNILRDKGFMSVYASDACNYNIPLSLGRKPNIDHVTTLFYCAHYLYSNYRASKSRRLWQRCIGDKMSHVWAMDYTEQFIQAYSSANLWVYTHFTAAHESTGQHATTLDEDLEDYLNKLLFKYGKDREVVILLNGDHGMRYGDFTSNTEAIQEHRLPALFFIGRHELLKQIPGAYDNLDYNSRMLTTKPDLRQTMLYLADWQYNNSFSKNRSNYYNLITERVPMDRSCRDAEIPIWYCSSFLPLPLDSYIFNSQHSDFPLRTFEEKALTDIIYRLSSIIIEDINSSVYSPYILYPKFLCQKLSLKSVRQVNYVNVENTDHMFRLVLDINESSNAVFDTWIVITKELLASELMKHENYSSHPIVYLGKKYYARLLTLVRVDKYGNTSCEKYARGLDLNGALCVCYSDLNKKYLDKRIKE